MPESKRPLPFWGAGGILKLTNHLQNFRVPVKWCLDIFSVLVVAPYQAALFLRSA
jgi:hypothetical protein